MLSPPPLPLSPLAPALQPSAGLRSHAAGSSPSTAPPRPHTPSFLLAAVEVSDLTAELKELAAESLIQPGHDLQLLGKTESGKELVVVGGEGAYLITADGAKVLDGPGGIWNVQMGYGQTKIVDAVSAQMTKLPFNSPFATIASPSAELAKRIADKAPGDLNHVFFVTGGSGKIVILSPFACCPSR